MTKRARDLTTLAFGVPFVMGTRLTQLATGGMSPSEWSRMWIEKPMAFAASATAMQMEMARASWSAMGRTALHRNDWRKALAAGIAPYAKAVRSNEKRLSR